jgi:Glycosyl transferase family 2
MDLAKIFCVTRDEYDLIEDFIVYHGKIFGYNNIVLIDNMSQNSHVLEIYEKYSKLGVTIYKEESYRGDDQGISFTKYMHQYKNECKFLIGLDTDEFIYSSEDTDPMAVRRILEDLPKDSTMFVISEYLWSIPDPTISDYHDYKHTRPAKNITKFHSIKEITKKNFYRSEAFEMTSVGNHDGRVSFGEKVAVPIGYLHLHNTGAKRMFERAQMCVDGYKYVDVNLSKITQFINLFVGSPWQNGYGHHKTKLYMFFLFKDIVIDYYTRNARRIPTSEEMNYFISKYFLKANMTLLTELFGELCSLSSLNPQNKPPSKDAISGILFSESRYDHTLMPQYASDTAPHARVLTRTLVADALAAV